MFCRIFSIGATRTWVARTPRRDDLLVWRNLRRPSGHPLGTRCPLVSAVPPQRSPDRGRGHRRFGGARAPFSRRPGHLLPVHLRLSSAQRSSDCAPLTEGERTDAVASRWRRDDRGLHLVEVECAMPSSRLTSSRHCFMAPGDAVELGGGVATLWPQTAPSALPSTSARRARQQSQSRGGRALVARRMQPLSPS